MRVAAFVIVLILAVGSVVVGKIHWNHKISAYNGVESNLVIDNEQNENELKNSKQNVQTIEPDISSFTKNLPEDVKNKIENAAKTGEPLTFVILGSKSTSIEETGWANLLKQQLIQNYGEKLFDISIHPISEKNSLEIVEETLHQEALDRKPDILLLEPFILKDNGEVRMEDRLENINMIIGDFVEVNSDVFVFLQPANPLYNATYYPKEVEELKQFAQSNNILYLDHWQAWPDQTSSEIQEFLSQDPVMSIKSVPNEQGHQLWADYLTAYFIAN
jgi:hypothetical protein